jgi:hypothetical protein
MFIIPILWIIAIALVLTIIILLILKSQSHSQDWTIFVPSQFDDAEKEIIPKKKNQYNKYINGIIHMDFLASKENFYRILRANQLESFAPKTWILKESYSIDPHTIVILKKEIQQQQGLTLARAENIPNILINDPIYTIVQEYLSNPFIIPDHMPNGKIIYRKINLRIYLYIIVFSGKLRAFIYNDGFVYYTPDSFNPESLNFANMITTGYIERDVYDRCPLTIQDLKIYLKDSRFTTLWNNIITKLLIIIKQYVPKFTCKCNYDNYHFQIFGVDVEPDKNLDVKFLEVNKGPDLNSKDNRDGALKTAMIQESYHILFGNFPQQFIEIFV